MSEHSEQINELAAALSKAQGKITGALKDSSNPFFKSKYADLASCWDACRDALSENGLCVIQTLETGEPVTIKWETEDKDTGEVKLYSVDSKEIVIVTTLVHESGQWVRSRLPLVPRDVTPQGIGSAITYGRRYGITAIVGVAQVDDDGNAASGTNGTSDRRGVGVTRPQGDSIKKSDPKLVGKYARLVIDAVNQDNETKIRDLIREMKEDQDLYIAVDAALPNSIRNRMRDEERASTKAAA